MTDLAQLRALLAKMTRAPYELRGPTYIYGNLQNDMNHTGDRVATTVTASDAAGIVALVNAAPALLASAARAAELEAEVSKLRGAISWIEPPFVDATTSHDELKKRVGFCVADAKRAALGEQP